MAKKQGISATCRVWRGRWPDSILSLMEGIEIVPLSLMLRQAWMQKTGLRWREASSVLYGPHKKRRSFIGSFLIVVGHEVMGWALALACNF